MLLFRNIIEHTCFKILTNSDANGQSDSGSKNEKAFPEFPSLPVRPIR